MHVLLVGGPQSKMIGSPSRSDYDTGRQPAVERLNNKMRLLSSALADTDRFDAPAQVIARGNAGDRFPWLQGDIGYLQHGADDRRNFLRPTKLDGAIGWFWLS